MPFGHEGISQIGVRLTVRDLDAHRRFHAEPIGFPEVDRASGAAFRPGESPIILEEDPGAPFDAGRQGTGWRYMTFQVFRVDEVHARIVAAGGRGGLAPTTLGTVARISMILDPHGNWVELSHRGLHCRYTEVISAFLRLRVRHAHRQFDR